MRTGRRPGRRSPTVAIVAPGAEFDALAALRAAYARRGIGALAVESAAPPPPGEVAEIAGDVDAVLLTFPRNRSPRTVLPWPAVATADGRQVPIGIVPSAPTSRGAGRDRRRGVASVERFALAAAAVHDRAGRPVAHTVPSVALLAQRSPRYLDLAGRIRRLLADQHHPAEATFWWPADEIVRDDVTRGLKLGLALAVYVGHGRPRGWVGYAGVRAHHLAGATQPGALFVSLACQTLSRHRTGMSFGESLVVQGTSAAAIGAVTTTRHVGNARWSLRLVDAVAAGAATAGELLAAAEPDDAVGRSYRLVGDPLAPLVDAPGARAAAEDLTADVVWDPEEVA